MSSPSSAAELLNAGLFEGGSPDFLSPVQSEVTSGDAESVSPRSSAGSEQSLTTQVRFGVVQSGVHNTWLTYYIRGSEARPASYCLQLLLGHRSNLFSKTSMSASSPSASLSASPVHGSSKGQKFNEQPGADEVSDFPHSIPGPAYAAPAVNSSSTLKHPPGHHKCDGLLPDLHQQFTSNAVPDPNSSPSGQVHPADTSVQPARKSTSPVEASSLLSIPSQLSSIRTPTPASSACPEVTSTAGSIHSSSTDRLMNASQASMLDPSSVPQLVSLHSANAIPHVEGSKAASSNGSAAPTFAQPEPGDSSDADVTDPSSLQEDQDIQFDLVSEPASRSSDAGLVSEPTSRLAGDDLVSEPASRSVDVDLVSRPANRSVEAVLVSAPASSPTGTKLPNAGNQNPRHDPHVTPDTGAPSPHESTSAELPSIALPQSTLSAEAGSLETSEAAVGTDTGLEAGIPDTDSPQAEPLEADPGTDAVLGPSTASRDSPQAEQLDAAAGMDAVPRPSTASSDTPQAEQSAANAGTDAVPGPSTACFNNPQAEQPEADAGLAAVNRPSMASCDSPQAEHPEAGIDALPGPSMTRCDSAHIERQSSSAAASTSGTEEPAPQTHRDAHRLDAQKGTSVTHLAKGVLVKVSCWVLSQWLCHWLL